MNRTLRFTGLLLASLTISTVAMAQQSSGGDGGRRDGEGAAGASAPSVFQLLREAPSGKARLTRAVELRGGRANGARHIRSAPPPTRSPPMRAVALLRTCLR